MFKKKVLYIEDEPYLARIVSDTLTSKGYELLHKKDGTRLTETIRQFNPDIVGTGCYAASYRWLYIGQRCT